MFPRNIKQTIKFTTLLLFLTATTPSLANANKLFVRQAQVIYTHPFGIQNPVGIAYVPSAAAFQILDDATQVFNLSTENQIITTAVSNAPVSDSINTAFDPQSNQLLAISHSEHRHVLVSGSNTLMTIAELDETTAAQGLTINPGNGDIFILVPRLQKILHIKAGLIDSTIKLPSGLNNSRGIAFNPSNHHLYTLNPDTQTLYELDITGKLIARRNLIEFGFIDPQGMTFAPSGDTTDAASVQSLFIADSGKRQTRLSPSKINRPTEGVGRVIELSMLKPPLVSKASSVTATLIHTTITANFNPISPDPAGITFLNSTDNLLLADSEVSEKPYYGDDNLFELSLRGTLLNTSTILTAQGGFSNEATGLSAINPANQHIFITDDDKRRVFELDLGSDGQYGTSDDQLVHTIKTSNFGSTDPEGVAFNPDSGKLYIAGGISAEVYIIAPGANGSFGDRDDVFSQFDTFSLGLTDPEGITYDTVSGHLFVVGEPKHLVFELTTQGSLVRTIDISAAFTSGVPKNPAGLTFAPDSQGSLNQHLYIADRGIDNDFNPRSSNDGKIYEIYFPTLSERGHHNQPPQVQAGEDITLTLPANSTELSRATVTDDGLNLATPNLNWTVDNGPGRVTFSPNNTALHPTAHFSASGTYTLRLTAADGEFSNSDTLTVSVNPDTPGVTTLDVRIAADSDDAEEKASGGMKLTSSDLELIFDRSRQTVGMRFTGLNIPQGITIQNAWIQFQTDEVNTGNSHLSIRGQANDDASTFSSRKRDISSRSTTSSTIAWTPDNWTIVGEQGVKQRTPSITPIIQEIINRPGWSTGNALAIIITGSGERTAESFHGKPNAAPLLHIEY